MAYGGINIVRRKREAYAGNNQLSVMAAKAMAAWRTGGNMAASAAEININENKA